MIQHFPYQQLGKADHTWLKANHHFSFGQYYNPRRMGFGTLRVINDDWVAPGTGFEPHPHRNMEIISFIRSGAITHQDSVGNKGVIPAGEVQVMSAGSGIVHSEYNQSDEPLTLYQIWIEPNQTDVEPRWDSRQFPNENNLAELPLLVSGYEQDKDKALFIHQQARIYGGNIKTNTKINVSVEHQAYVLASKGEVHLFDGKHRITMQAGDGAQVTEINSLTIEANKDAEVIVIDAPLK